jgi:hypothetical protein
MGETLVDPQKRDGRAQMMGAAGGSMGGLGWRGWLAVLG